MCSYVPRRLWLWLRQTGGDALTRGGKAGFFKVFLKNPILPSHRKSGFIGFFLSISALVEINITGQKQDRDSAQPRGCAAS
jgi:hypothetical protein